MNKQQDYPYIMAWGLMNGSSAYYINDQVEQARIDKAPSTATYKNAAGEWRTFEDITNKNTKETIAQIVASGS